MITILPLTTVEEKKERKKKLNGSYSKREKWGNNLPVEITQGVQPQSMGKLLVK